MPNICLIGIYISLYSYNTSRCSCHISKHGSNRSSCGIRLSAAGFTPEVIKELRAEYEKQRAADGFTIGAHLSCLKASAAADVAYGPGFKDLSEEQQYHVWNAPYTAVKTGEDAADVIAKLRSVYQKGRTDKVVAPVADTKDEAPGLATRIVLAAAAAGDAAAGAAAAGAAAAGGAAGFFFKFFLL